MADESVTRDNVEEMVINILSVVNRVNEYLPYMTDKERVDALRELSAFDGSQLTTLVDNIQDTRVDLTPNYLKTSSDYFYGIGETCLLIDPFDNYRLFTLYKDYETKEPLNVYGDNNFYIVFKSGTKEIRIPEYKEYGPNIELDREHGQVLFKINKKQANDIINLKNKEFYITRIFEVYDETTDSYIASDEEVIFSGFWAERNSEKESRYMNTINELKDLLEKRTAAMDQMVQTINDLVAERATNEMNISDKDKEIADLEKEIEELTALLNDNVPGWNDADNNEEAVLLDSRTVLVDYSGADEDIKKTLDELTKSNPNYVKNIFETLKKQ